jgi:membrane-bound ClpP family serine protease
MISKEQYREAVQLYNKAITVLKNHSHVLSFKNIQERTEQMMRDLRHKVMDLLDDPQLEAVKVQHEYPDRDTRFYFPHE